MEKNYIYLPRVIIDTHCHGRDLQQSNKTTVEKVLEEARKGKIDITIFQPNTNPPLDNFKSNNHYYQERIVPGAVKNSLHYPQFVYFGLTDDNFAEADLCYSNNLFTPGGKAYDKGVTTGSNALFVSKDSSHIEHMKILRKHNKPGIYHCDDPGVIAEEGHTIRAEVKSVRHKISLARLVPGVKIIFPHLSCADSVEEVLKARLDYKINASIEIMPQYLWFTSEGHNWNPGLEAVFYHCFNNLRGLEHREYLRKFVAKGYSFTWIASDNACHTREEKLLKKLGGIPSNQEMVPVICTIAKEMGISDDKIVGLLSFNAARCFGIRVPYQLVKYELKEKIDDITYNNRIVENPWNGSSLLFPVSVN